MPGRCRWRCSTTIFAAPARLNARDGLRSLILAEAEAGGGAGLPPVPALDGVALFWRAVFGLLPQPQRETPDPYGLVLSRALVSPGGRVRLALNASDSRGTATGRFVSTFAGAGVHHVALSTPDIGRAASALEALGAPVLPMPDNYYDDLAARWGLDDAALADLQRHALLYDGDGAGRFWHLYTDAFHDRFFFEVV